MDRMTAALIPAAGSSGRMGRDKATLETLSGAEFAVYLIRAFLRFGCCPVVLVVHPGFDRIRFRRAFHPETDSRLILIVNPDPAKGRSESIRTGLQRVPAGMPCFLQNVDTPYADPELLEALAREVPDHGCSVPVTGNRRGHPILLGPALADTLREKAFPFDFREELERTDRREVPWSSAEILLNINTPGDYSAYLHPDR